MSEAVQDGEQERFGSGIAGAVVLHVVLLGAIAALGVWGHFHEHQWGGDVSSMGAIQASMVSALPLPEKTPPVPQQVLAPDVTSAAPVPPPKEATQPPPKPTDVLIKDKTPEKPVKAAPVEQPTPPKHAQPTPATPKAQMGQVAAQLPSSTVQVQNGSATATIQDRAFGNRYAYYGAIVSRTVARNWYTGEADPRASQGKKVTLLFDIAQDGTPSNVRVETASGSPSLDQSAVHALERVDTFGPLPAGNSLTVEFTFVYQQP